MMTASKVYSSSEITLKVTVKLFMLQAIKFHKPDEKFLDFILLNNLLNSIYNYYFFKVKNTKNLSFLNIILLRFWSGLRTVPSAGE